MDKAEEEAADGGLAELARLEMPHVLRNVDREALATRLVEDSLTALLGANR